jgi:hypothetical protein
MTSIIQRLLHSELRSTFATLAVLAIAAAPAFKVVVSTAGSNWN